MSHAEFTLRRRELLRRLTSFSIFLLAVVQPGSGQEVGTLPLSNLSVLDALVRESAVTIIPECHRLNVSQFAIQLTPTDLAPFFRNSLIRTFTDSGFRVVSVDSARVLQVGILNGGIHFPSVWKSGIFGSRVAQRVASVDVSFFLDPLAEGVPVLTRNVIKVFSDTVAVDAINDLRHPSLALEQGELPSEGIFSGVLEPLVLLGALAVGIFLLFTVRS